MTVGDTPFKKWLTLNTFIFDIDGVLTDGIVQVTEAGGLMRKLNTKDAYALQLAVKKGYQVIIMTGFSGKGIAKRLKNLGVKQIYTGCTDKLKQFKALDVVPIQCLYMGDDIPDLRLFAEVGVSTCPADAAPELLDKADYIAEKTGGQCCVREVIEKTLKMQDKWLDGISDHLW